MLKAAWLRHFPCCAYIDGAVGPVGPPAGPVGPVGPVGPGMQQVPLLLQPQLFPQLFPQVEFTGKLLEGRTVVAEQLHVGPEHPEPLLGLPHLGQMFTFIL